MIDCASAALNEKQQMVNSLNVFPVPDGDTGTNMSLTLANAAKNLLQTGPDDTVGKTVNRTAGYLLRGARGNSGVILSLLFRGMAKSMKELDTADGADFAAALTEGVSAAYNAIMKPTEGTILTVSRLAAKAASSCPDTAIESVLSAAIEAGQTALAETIEQNPVLKKAGVVDAGGMGFLIVLQGMLDGLRGQTVAHSPAESVAAEPTQSPQAAFSTEEIRFPYCTEFIVSRNGSGDPADLRGWLDTMGDSLVLVDDEELIKVHVHTAHPGSVLEEALRYGSFVSVKVENMRLQHSEILGAEEAAPSPAPAPEEPKTYGVVTVCAGAGLAQLMRDYGADAVVEGGQTMNPSTEDILSAIETVNAETVFVLPNNKNIILAAQQAAPLSTHKVVVVGTKTVPEGITALLTLDPGLSPEENADNMLEAASAVTTMSVTYAARPSDFDGVQIHQWDYLALSGGKLVGTGPDVMQLLRSLGRSVAASGAGCVTVYYGEDVSEEDAQRASDVLTEACPEAEILLVNGGQPVYYYLISAE